MNGKTFNILLIEDSPGDARLIKEYLGQSSICRFEVNHVRSLVEAFSALEEGASDAILLDLGLPDSQGIDTFYALRDYGTKVPILVLTGLKSEDTALKAMRAGAQDFLIKDQIDEYSLPHVVRYAVERFRIGHELQERERQLRNLMGNLEGMVYRCQNKPDWPMVFVSQGAKTLTGYAPEEITVGGEIHYGEIIHPRDRDRVWEAVQAAVKKDRAFKVQYRIVTKEGRVKWVWEEGNAIGERDDQLMLEGYISDITERVESKKALQESERRYRRLAETAQDYIVVHDLDGEITYINQAGMAFSGYEEEEILHKSVADFIPQDQMDTLLTRQEKREEGDRRKTLYRTEFVNKEGRRVPVEVSSSPVMVDGEVRSVLLVARDIRERVEAEQALRESEQRYRMIFDTMPVAIWEEDFSPVGRLLKDLESQGVTDLRAYMDDHPSFIDRVTQKIEIKDVNAETLDMFGAGNKEELLGSLDKITTPQMRAFMRDLILAIHRGETYFEGETVNCTLQGEEINVWLTMRIPPEREEMDEVLISMMDITDRKQAEKKYRNLYNSIRDAILIANTDREIIDCNPAFTEIFGYELDEIQGKQTEYIYQNHEQYREMGREIKEHDAEENFFFTVNYRKKSGEVFPGETNVFYLKDESGETLAFVGLIRDITERRETQEALMEREEKFRAIFNNANDAIFLHRFGTESRPGTFIEVNKVACDMLGYSREEFEAMSPYDIVDMDSIPEGFDIVKELVEEGEATYELQYMAKDGPRIPVEINSLVFKLRDKRMVLSIARDITERRKAQESLRKSEERYRSLFESVPIGLYRTTPEGDLTDANEAMVDILGYPDRETLLQINASDFYADPREERIWQALMDQEGEVRGYEAQFFRYDGTVIWIQDNTRAIYDASGSLQAYQGSLEDITQRKLAEERNKHRSEQMQALREIGVNLASELDVNDLLEMIVRQAVDLVKAEAGSFNRYYAHREVLDLDVYTGYTTLPDKTSLARGEGLIGTVWERQETIRVDDYQRWEGHSPRWVDHFGHAACIGVPVVWGGELLGVLEVLREHGSPFAEDDAQFLELFATQAAVAMHNAQLFENAEQRLHRLQALREIDQTISGSLDLKTTLNVLVDRLINNLNVDAGSILLYESGLQTLEYITGQGFRTSEIPQTKVRVGEGQAGKAALRRQIVHIPDLTLETVSFRRAKLIRQEGFMSYFGVPLIAKGELVGVLEAFHRSLLEPSPEWMDFLETLAGQAAIAIDRLNLFNNLERSNMELIQAYNEVIEGWARALELRDQETEGHSRRVEALTMEIARKMGVEDKDLANMRQGALLHDIGKMGIPDRILQKPGKLTEEEWELMRKHPSFAYEMLSPIDHLKSALDIPYCHHEKWDGSGYPRGLEGMEIPLAARIFAVADVWDALRSDRPYRDAWPDEKALDYIKQESGKHFDPQVVEAFLEIINR